MIEEIEEALQRASFTLFGVGGEHSCFLQNDNCMDACYMLINVIGLLNEKNLVSGVIRRRKKAMALHKRFDSSYICEKKTVFASDWGQILKKSRFP